VAKFLRRTPGQENDPAGEFLKDLDLSGPEDAGLPPREAARKIFERLGLIQSRAKKLRLLQEAGRLQAEWPTLLFVELLADPIEEIRDLAVRELIERRDVPLDELCLRLGRPPWFAKCAALRVLAAKKSAPTAKSVRAVVEDPNAEVRKTAAAALGEIGGREARSLLVRLSRDANAYVRAAAVEALDKICDFKFS